MPNINTFSIYVGNSQITDNNCLENYLSSKGIELLL